MDDQINRLTAYLNSMGNCEEALNRYAEIFGGKNTVANRYDNTAMNVPKGFHDRVLHATLQFGWIAAMASDIIPKNPKKAGSGTGDAALSLDVSDAEAGRRIFGRLAEGGKVGVKFEKQFWGAWHGNLRDRFGIRWMINCAG